MAKALPMNRPVPTAPPMAIITIWALVKCCCKLALALLNIVKLAIKNRKIGKYRLLIAHWGVYGQKNCASRVFTQAAPGHVGGARGCRHPSQRQTPGRARAAIRRCRRRPAGPPCQSGCAARAGVSALRRRRGIGHRFDQAQGDAPAVFLRFVHRKSTRKAAQQRTAAQAGVCACHQAAFCQCCTSAAVPAAAGRTGRGCRAAVAGKGKSRQGRGRLS